MKENIVELEKLNVTATITLRSKDYTFFVFTNVSLFTEGIKGRKILIGRNNKRENRLRP